jgi:hypothetical protein
LLAACAATARAQNYGMDARVIGMGAVGSTRNVAEKLVEQKRPYRRLGLPLGLMQVLPNKDVFFPDTVDDKVSDKFDLFRAMEYAAGPVNYTFDRDSTGTGQALVNDVLNDELNRDLNVYRGFRPTTRLTAEGVGAPSWGYTFRKPNAGGGFHGIYIGAGPYLTVTTETGVDPQLADWLGSSEPQFFPNSVFGVTHDTTFQAAAAITGGYRFVQKSGGSDDDPPAGLFLAVNASYLRGVHFDQITTDITFETNAQGLVANEAESTTTPLALRYFQSTSGTGFAVDAGALYFKDRWEFGVGVNGIGNYINWTGVEVREAIDHSFVDDSDDDSDSDPVPAPDVRIELPVNVSTNAAYHADKWSALAEYARRFRGNNFQGGLEYLLGRMAVRGGARYARDRWPPAGGVGVHLTPTFAVDVAVYGTSTNVERRRHAALAVSLRWNRART